LQLKSNEVLLINLKVFPFKSFFKNGAEEIVKNLVLTTERVLFVDYSFLGSGWRFREILLLDDIQYLTASKNEEPFIKFQTKENYFEIYFRNFIPYKNKIAGIMNCIKKRNSHVSAISEIVNS
jgi:hypothetical protein